MKNPVNFIEIPINPQEVEKTKIEQWTEDVKDDGIDDDVKKFVLKDIDDKHPARPKPLYKTHKTDEEGYMLKPVKIRNVSTACGTPTENLSKFCQTAIKHLTDENILPRNNKSTNAALRRIIFINENFSPLKEESILVFPDIVKMYPSTDTDEAVEKVNEKYQDKQSEHGLSPECVMEALRICNSCNCIQFNGSYYIPCKGCPTGPAHVCEMTDVWIGSLTEKHLRTCPVETLHFSIYRDDGLDILINGEEDLPILKEHFDNLHPNLKWEFNQGKEGAYLDLWVMIRDGRIETRIFTKSEPIYIGPKSCHDPKVFKSIFTGVGLRIRLNCSQDMDFDIAVEKYSRAMSEFKYKKSKN